MEWTTGTMQQKIEKLPKKLGGQKYYDLVQQGRREAERLSYAAFYADYTLDYMKRNGIKTTGFDLIQGADIIECLSLMPMPYDYDEVQSVARIKHDFETVKDRIAIHLFNGVVDDDTIDTLSTYYAKVFERAFLECYETNAWEERDENPYEYDVRNLMGQGQTKGYLCESLIKSLPTENCKAFYVYEATQCPPPDNILVDFMAAYRPDDYREIEKAQNRLIDKLKVNQHDYTWEALPRGSIIAKQKEEAKAKEQDDWER